jgi:hypothetical protein
VIRAVHGWRQRLFAIVGAVTGIGGGIAFSLVTRKLDMLASAAALALYVAVMIPFALWLFRVTRQVRCPQCQSDQARLVYDERGSEHVSCAACGCRLATGYSHPND